MSFHIVLDSNPNIAKDTIIPQTFDNIQNGVAFVVGQLTYLEQEAYKVEYADIVYDQLVPLDFSVPSFMTHWGYKTYDAVTMGKFIGASGDDIPNVSLTAKMQTFQLFTGGIGFQYTLDELETTAQMNMPIDTSGQEMSIEGYERHAQDVALYGDASRGITGLLNNASVPKITAAKDFTSDAEEAVKQIKNAMEKCFINSKQKHLPDTVLIPTSVYTLLNKTPYTVSTGTTAVISTDKTWLTYLQENNLYSARAAGKSLNIMPLAYLDDTTKTSGKEMIVVYEKNPRNLTMKIARPIEFLPPQPKDLNIKVPARYKFGGVEFRFPVSACYLINA